MALVDCGCHRPLVCERCAVSDACLRDLSVFRRLASRRPMGCGTVRNGRIDVARVVWPSLPCLDPLRRPQHYLRRTWITQMLPPSLGLTGSISWLLHRLEPLAGSPGGAALWKILWTSAICGWAFAITRPLGLVLAGVALSPFAFSGVVPLYERFSIWMVPALYAGVALLIDRAVRLGHDAFARRRWALLTVATLVLLVQFRLVADIFGRGRVELDARRGSTHKHRLDDRAQSAGS